MSDRAIVEVDNGMVFYRASSLGGCLRMLALARQGFDEMPPPPGMLEVFKAGNRAEAQAWQKGYITGSAQEYVKLEVTEKIWVTGHLDGWDVVWDQVANQGAIRARRSRTKGTTYEVKSQSEGEWGPIRESSLWERYSWQFSVYMLATGLPLTVVRVLRDKEGNVSDKCDEVLTEPPHTLAEIRARVMQVELMARKDLSEVACEKVEFPCPFFYTHVGGDENVREYVDDYAAVMLAKEYRAAVEGKELADRKVKACKQTLLDWMGDKRKLGLPGGWKLTRYEVKGRHVEYDSKGYWGLRVTEPKDEVEDE